MLNPYRNLDELPFVNKKATKNVLNSLMIFIYAHSCNNICFSVCILLRIK